MITGVFEDKVQAARPRLMRQCPGYRWLPNENMQFQAARDLLSKVVPNAKHGTVNFELPEINSAEDCETVVLSVIRAISNGEMTPDEGRIITEQVKFLAEIGAYRELHARLAEVEDKLSAASTRKIPREFISGDLASEPSPSE